MKSDIGPPPAFSEPGKLWAWFSLAGWRAARSTWQKDPAGAGPTEPHGAAHLALRVPQAIASAFGLISVPVLAIGGPILYGAANVFGTLPLNGVMKLTEHFFPDKPKVVRLSPPGSFHSTPKVPDTLPTFKNLPYVAPHRLGPPATPRDYVSPPRPRIGGPSL